MFIYSVMAFVALCLNRHLHPHGQNNGHLWWCIVTNPNYYKLMLITTEVTVGTPMFWDLPGWYMKQQKGRDDLHKSHPPAAAPPKRARERRLGQRKIKYDNTVWERRRPGASSPLSRRERSRASQVFFIACHATVFQYCVILGVDTPGQTYCERTYHTGV